MKNQTTTPAAPVQEPEQAAALAELQAEAASEAPIPGTPEAIAAEAAANAPQPPDLAAEFAGLLEILTGTAARQVPALREIWTPEAIKEEAEAIAAVCNKRGWLQGGIFGGDYAEEIRLLLVSVPLIVATVAAIKAALRELKDKTAGTMAPPAADPTPPANVEPASPEYTLARG